MRSIIGTVRRLLMRVDRPTQFDFGEMTAEHWPDGMSDGLRIYEGDRVAASPDGGILIIRCRVPSATRTADQADRSAGPGLKGDARLPLS